jgi:hypothetical protein
MSRAPEFITGVVAGFSIKTLFRAAALAFVPGAPVLVITIAGGALSGGIMSVWRTSKRMTDAQKLARRHWSREAFARGTVIGGLGAVLGAALSNAVINSDVVQSLFEKTPEIPAPTNVSNTTNVNVPKPEPIPVPTAPQVTDETLSLKTKDGSHTWNVKLHCYDPQAGEFKTAVETANINKSYVIPSSGMDGAIIKTSLPNSNDTILLNIREHNGHLIWRACDPEGKNAESCWKSTERLKRCYVEITDRTGGYDDHHDGGSDDDSPYHRDGSDRDHDHHNKDRDSLGDSDRDNEGEWKCDTREVEYRQVADGSCVDKTVIKETTCFYVDNDGAVNAGESSSISEHPWADQHGKIYHSTPPVSTVSSTTTVVGKFVDPNPCGCNSTVSAGFGPSWSSIKEAGERFFEQFSGIGVASAQEYGDPAVSDWAEQHGRVYHTSPTASSYGSGADYSDYNDPAVSDWAEQHGRVYNTRPTASSYGSGADYSDYNDPAVSDWAEQHGRAYNTQPQTTSYDYGYGESGYGYSDPAASDWAASDWAEEHGRVYYSSPQVSHADYGGGGYGYQDVGYDYYGEPYGRGAGYYSGGSEHINGDPRYDGVYYNPTTTGYGGSEHINGDPSYDGVYYNPTTTGYGGSEHINGDPSYDGVYYNPTTTGYGGSEHINGDPSYDGVYYNPTTTGYGGSEHINGDPSYDGVYYNPTTTGYGGSEHINGDPSYDGVYYNPTTTGYGGSEHINGDPSYDGVYYNPTTTGYGGSRRNYYSPYYMPS